MTHQYPPHFSGNYGNPAGNYAPPPGQYGGSAGYGYAQPQRKPSAVPAITAAVLALLAAVVNLGWQFYYLIDDGVEFFLPGSDGLNFDYLLFLAQYVTPTINSILVGGVAAILVLAGRKIGRVLLIVSAGIDIIFTILTHVMYGFSAETAFQWFNTVWFGLTPVVILVLLVLPVTGRWFEWRAQQRVTPPPPHGFTLTS